MLVCGDAESEPAVTRRLMLLRHAKTERAAPGERDRDRKLTARGRSDAPLIGAYMARHSLVPDLAVVSPAQRAQETWTLIATALGKTPRVINDERIYNAGTGSLIALIGEIGDTQAARSLLIVGHNPGLHDIAVRLASSGEVALRERLTEKLPTAGLVVIEFAFDDWSRVHRHGGRLEHFIMPRHLAATD
jgi:phosphohistidine phosphatase